MTFLPIVISLLLGIPVESFTARNHHGGSHGGGSSGPSQAGDRPPYHDPGCPAPRYHNDGLDGLGETGRLEDTPELRRAREKQDRYDAETKEKYRLEGIAQAKKDRQIRAKYIQPQYEPGGKEYPSVETCSKSRGCIAPWYGKNAIIDGHVEEALFYEAVIKHRQNRIDSLEKRANVVINNFEFWDKQPGFTAQSSDKYKFRFAEEALTWTKVASFFNSTESEGYQQAAVASTDIADSLLTAMDLITSFTPGLSNIRDLFEAITGINILTLEPISNFARGMAIIGAFSGGIGKLTTASITAMHVFDNLQLAKIRPKWVKNAIGDDAETIKIFRQARQFLITKPISEIRETVGFFKKYKFYGSDTDHMASSITNAFMRGAKREVTQGRVSVVRYSQNGNKGYWVTTKELADPHNSLALLHSDPVKMSRHTIKQGSEILRGVAAPQKKIDELGNVLFDRPGGAEQIFLDTKFLE